MIQMRIQEEAELYNPLDPSDSQISEKVYHYQNHSAPKRRLKKNP